MEGKTIPVALSEEFISNLDKIAEKELSSRNRIIRLAVQEYLKKNATTKNQSSP